MNSRVKQQRGGALIVALFIMSLVAACAVAMMMRLNIDIYRTKLIFNNKNGELYSQGAVAAAKDWLTENLRKAKPNQVTDPIPLHESLVSNGYEITYTLTDQQGKLNVNNVPNAGSQQAFISLLQLVDSKLTAQQCSHIALALKDWITHNPSNTKNFAKDYENASPPYQAPHKAMASISELRLISGMNGALYEKLLPYVAALPKTRTAININTASLPVMMAVLKIPESIAKGIVEARKDKPFQNNEDRLPRYGFDVSQVTLQSDYFLLESNVKVDQQNITMNTLFSRNTDNKQPRVTVLWQTKGTL